jgi:L-gulonate 3-dehydrogenase
MDERATAVVGAGLIGRAWAITFARAGRARCVVAHPINPPYLVPAVELVPAPWTNRDVMERGAAFLRAVG